MISLYCPKCGYVGVSLYTCPHCAGDRPGRHSSGEAKGSMNAKVAASAGRIWLPDGLGGPAEWVPANAVVVSVPCSEWSNDLHKLAVQFKEDVDRH